MYIITIVYILLLQGDPQYRLKKLVMTAHQGFRKKQLKIDEGSHPKNQAEGLQFCSSKMKQQNSFSQIYKSQQLQPAEFEQIYNRCAALVNLNYMHFTNIIDLPTHGSQLIWQYFYLAISLYREIHFTGGSAEASSRWKHSLNQSRQRYFCKSKMWVTT